MKPKVKKSDFKLIDKMSRIDHNAKLIKQRAESINAPSLPSNTESSRDTSTAYAVDNSEQSAEKILFQAKEFAIKTRNINRSIKTRKQLNRIEIEGVKITPSYVREAKRRVKADKQRKEFAKTASTKPSVLSIFKANSKAKNKAFVPKDKQSAILALGSLAVVAILSITLIFGAVFSSDNESFFGTFIYPFDNPERISITSEYGYRIHPVYGTRKFHSGVDFGTPHHCNIYASAPGTVVTAGVNDGYGNCVIIQHDIMGQTMYTLYGHLSEIKVQVGQPVLQGEVIGIEGGEMSDPNHGTSTGHHLHFEVRNEYYVTVDPMLYLIEQAI